MTALFDDGGGDLGMASLVQPESLPSRFAQVQHAPFRIRSTVIDTDHHRGPRLVPNDFQLRSERERPMCASIILAIKNFTAGSFPAVISLAVKAGITRKSVTDLRLCNTRFRRCHASIALAVCCPAAPRESNQDTEKSYSNKTREHTATLLEIVHAVVCIL